MRFLRIARTSLAATFCTVVVVGSACEAPSGPLADSPPRDDVSQLVLTAHPDTLVEGDSLALEVVLVREGAREAPIGVTWSSSARDVLQVTPSGIAIGIGPGQATVTAVVGELMATAALAIKQRPFAIDLSSAASLLEPGETIHLAAIVRDRRGDAIPGTAVEWSSDEPGVVQVLPDARATGFRLGTVTVRATVGPLQASAVMTVLEPLFRAVSAGGYHTCAVTTSGSLYCWGENMFGQLGNGSFTDRPEPVRVSGARRFLSASAGSGYTCGVDDVGAVLCWGDNSMMESGAFGAGKRNAVPLVSALDVPAVSVSTGDMSHTCALGVDGQAYCWGYNRFGQVGEGSTAGQRFPVPVAGGAAYRQVVANGMRSCALDSDGRASCWGRGGVAQYGEATELETCSSLPCRTTPAVIEDAVRFATLAVGYVHTCGLTAEGHAYCWGSNESGQLGIAGDSVTSATALPGDLVFAAISSGRSHTCAITGGGQAYCWGSNVSGELGDGSTVGRAEARLVEGEVRFADIEVGLTHSCGLTVEGAVMCWGDNIAGQLGDPNLGASLVLQPVPIRFP